MELEQEITKAFRNGLQQAIRDRLGTSYNNPIDPFINQAIKDYAPEFGSMLGAMVGGIAGDPEFKEELRRSLRAKLAKLLVERFGGELEKQVNVLKSDPITRAKITLALEEIVKHKE